MFDIENTHLFTRMKALNNLHKLYRSDCIDTHCILKWKANIFKSTRDEGWTADVSYNVELVLKVFMECVDQDSEQMCCAFFYIRSCMATEKNHERPQ